jgi:hypothetical protein
MMDSKSVRNMQSSLPNKVEKQCILLPFIIRKYHNAHSSEWQNPLAIHSNTHCVKKFSLEFSLILEFLYLYTGLCCQSICCQSICCQSICFQPICCQPVCSQPTRGGGRLRGPNRVGRLATPEPLGMASGWRPSVKTIRKLKFPERTF